MKTNAELLITPVGYEHWISPNGVAHLVPVLRDGLKPVVQPCATCGRVHDVTHFRTARLYQDTMPAELRGRQCVTEVRDWPYECDAKDQHPEATVYVCTLHSVWWWE